MLHDEHGNNNSLKENQLKKVGNSKVASYANISYRFVWVCKCTAIFGEFVQFKACLDKADAWGQSVDQSYF